MPAKDPRHWLLLLERLAELARRQRELCQQGAWAEVMELAERAYDAKEQELGPEVMRRVERAWVLNVIDRLWTHHLTALDDLREGIGLRAYGQRDPLIEYKVEAHRMFEALQAAIRHDVVYAIYHLTLRQETVRRPRQMITNRDVSANGHSEPVRSRKIGRNDPCPCGSGKKYKRCHGR